MRDALSQASDVIGTAWRLPGRRDGLITGLEEGTVAVDVSRLERRLDRLERVVQRGLAVVVFGILLIGGILLRATDGVFGGALMAASVVPLIVSLLPPSRRRRR